MVLGLILVTVVLITDPPLKRKEETQFKALQNDLLFGGDMLLPTNYMLRNGIMDEDFRWPGYPGGARIPYVIDETLDDHQNLILKGMDAYHKSTCVKFVPRTTEKDYIKIFKGNGCYSLVGRDKYTEQPQELSLGPGCLNVGTVIHELGHAIGFYHEQNRSDRDDYLIVHPNNIPPNRMQNFKKLKADENILLTPFDYDSIMIYGNYAFSKHPYEDMTMEAKNGQTLHNPFEKSEMTPSDIKKTSVLACRTFLV